MIVSCMSMQIYCMSIHSLVCLPILSVCPLFCPCVYPSVHPYVCNQIVNIAKSIAKSCEINLKSMVQFNGKRITIKKKKIVKRKLHRKAASLFVRTRFFQFGFLIRLSDSFYPVTLLGCRSSPLSPHGAPSEPQSNQKCH